MKKRMLIVLSSLIFLSGCQMIPQELEVPEQTITDLGNVGVSDVSCKCHQIRVGGKVLHATVLANNYTKIEVLSFPLDLYTAKPKLTQMVNGRFIAVIPSFIDPQVLRDQYITVVGMLDGIVNGKIDHATYKYPLIDVTNYRLWKQVIRYESTTPRFRVGFGFGSGGFNNVGFGYGGEGGPGFIGQPIINQGEIIPALE